MGRTLENVPKYPEKYIPGANLGTGGQLVSGIPCKADAHKLRSVAEKRVSRFSGNREYLSEDGERTSKQT
jgi:hypothetical protein